MWRLGLGSNGGSVCQISAFSIDGLRVIRPWNQNVAEHYRTTFLLFVLKRASMVNSKSKLDGNHRIFSTIHT